MLELIRQNLSEMFSVDPSEITMDTRFVEDLGVDSLDMVELIQNLEEEYNVEFDAEDMSELKTVGEVISYLQDKGIQD